MSKKILTVFAVLLVALIAVGIVAAETSVLPGSGWKSGQQIQNVGSATASVQFQAYSQTGTATNCGSKSAAPGGSVNFLTDVDCSGLPAGFVGSAVVSADQPIAAIVNVNNRGTGLAAGQYRGTDGADVANTIAFPLVKNAFGGRTTTFYVQNASGSTNNITATFRIGANTYTKTFNAVPSNAMVVINPSDATPAFPANSVGSLTVTGTQALAGTSLEHEASAPVAQNMQASKAFTPNDFDDVAYCPLVRNAHTGNQMTTGIQAQNVGASAQTVKVDYAYSIGGGPLQTKTVTSPSLASGESFTFFGADGTYGLPAGSLGSATVTGTGGGDIAVVVNDRAFSPAVNPTRVTTYSCFASSGATTKVVLPLYKEVFGGNTTGIQVQNVGSAATTVSAVYAPTGGPAVTITSASIQPGASYTYFGLPSLNNTFGGVTLTASQPIVAMANESSYGPGASGQDTKNYEGFNQ